MPSFCKNLYAQADPDAKRPVEVAIGKEVSGQFRTAKHKEYLDRFCKGLAYTIAQTLMAVDQQRALRVVEPLPADRCVWLQGAAKASTYFHRETWLPDYQG